MTRSNITTHEGFADRIIDDFREGGTLHGGNLQSLMLSEPDLALHVLGRTLGEIGVTPGSVEELADICVWNQPEDRDDFVHRFTPSEE